MHTHTLMFVCLYTYLNMYIHKSMSVKCIFRHICTCLLHTYIYTWLHTHICIYPYTYRLMHVCLYINLNVYIHLSYKHAFTYMDTYVDLKYVYLCTYNAMYMYTYADMHMYIHTYM